MAKRRKAYKFRLRLDSATKRQFNRWAGACRFVWNHALELQKKHYEETGKYLNMNELSTWLISIKQEHAWLYDIPAQTLQAVLAELDNAYQRFFKNLGKFPKFKNRGSRKSFRINSFPNKSHIDNENGRIRLPKIGWQRYIKSRDIEGLAKNATISFTAGYWYISIQTEIELIESPHQADASIGLDRGVAHAVVDSNGIFHDMPDSVKKIERKRKHYHRKMNRRGIRDKNGRISCVTKRYLKAKRQAAKWAKKVSDARNDFRHKVTSEIVKNNNVIVLEDLRTVNMTGSASGTIEEPGKNVAQKRGLNREILRVGWGIIGEQIEYKAGWAGGTVVKINPAYTSQTCAACGNVSADNRKSQSKFDCTECGYSENADVNAARNILAAGHAVLARGEPKQAKPTKLRSWGSVKRVPAERLVA